MGEGHGHGHGTAAGRHRARLVAVPAITLAILAVEVAGALVSGSLALLADAGHVGTDAAGIPLALFAARSPASTTAEIGARAGCRTPMHTPRCSGVSGMTARTWVGVNLSSGTCARSSRCTDHLASRATTTPAVVAASG